jgi:hypothetical protein
MSKKSKSITVRMPSAEEDKAITAAARSDPDTQAPTPKQLKSMLPIKALPGSRYVGVASVHEDEGGAILHD